MQLYLFFLLLSWASALHFYLEKDEEKCFFEELPQNTLVALKFESEVLTQSAPEKVFAKPENVKIHITVSETFDSDHKVVSQKTSSAGDFTFTSLDSGEHKFCVKASGEKRPLRVFLDLVIGNSNIVDTKKMDQVGFLLWKLSDLSSKTEEVRREQDNIREREASFRDTSESANNMIVKWTLFQVTVLVAIGLWQLSHLKSFFIKQKVV